MKKLLLLCLSVLAASCDTATRQFESRLDEIVSGHKAFVGVAIRTPDGKTIARNDSLLPMMSVFKFPVALAVLDRMQREGTPLTQPISITPDLLLPGTYSPMRDSLPESGGTLTLGQLLRYTVSESDNIACDILLREAGGPEAVEAYVRSLGIGGIRIAASEAAQRGVQRSPATVVVRGNDGNEQTESRAASRNRDRTQDRLIRPHGRRHPHCGQRCRLCAPARRTPLLHRRIRHRIGRKRRHKCCHRRCGLQGGIRIFQLGMSGLYNAT